MPLGYAFGKTRYEFRLTKQKQKAFDMMKNY